MNMGDRLAKLEQEATPAGRTRLAWMHGNGVVDYPADILVTDIVHVVSWTDVEDRNGCPA